MSVVSVPVLVSGDRSTDLFAEAVKANIDSLTGQQKSSVALLPLASTATLQEVIVALNILINRAGR